MSSWFLQLVRLKRLAAEGSWALEGVWGRGFTVPMSFLKLHVNSRICMFLRRVESFAWISFSTGKEENFCTAPAVRILWVCDWWHTAQINRLHIAQERKACPCLTTLPPNKSPSYCVKDAEAGTGSNLKLTSLNFRKTLGISWGPNCSHW